MEINLDFIDEQLRQETELQAAIELAIQAPREFQFAPKSIILEQPTRKV